MSNRANCFIRCKDIDNLFVRGCKPDAVLIPFLSFEGQAKDVSIVNNDLHKVATPFIREPSVHRKEIHTTGSPFSF
jgi:hypothetical protein